MAKRRVDDDDDAVARAVRWVAVGVAHELNNPLTVLQLRAELMLEAPGLDADLRNQVRVMRDSVGRMAHVVRTLQWLGHARTPVRADVDVIEVLRGAVDDVAAMLPGARISLAANLPLRVLADREALGFALAQVLWYCASLGGVVVTSESAALVFGVRGVDWPVVELEALPIPEAPDRWPGLALTVAAAVVRDHGGRVLTARDQLRLELPARP